MHTRLEHRITQFRAALLDWAKKKKRHFFWRESDTSPFEILVSEVLLCRTRAEAAEPVARALVARYPDPTHLADAKLAILEKLLRPIGLSRKRSRGLRNCARQILNHCGGLVPNNYESLINLSSVGPYVAEATLCFGFSQPLPVLDANVSRVYKRVFSVTPPSQKLGSASELRKLAGRVLDRRRPQEFNWALLDLGAIVCTARNPACNKCPVARICDAQKDRARGIRRIQNASDKAR
jgi:A/G-specific adenine glycosylase